MWKDKLKQEWNENPIKVIALTAFTANSASRLLNAWSAAKSRRAYVKQIKYRTKK